MASQSGTLLSVPRHKVGDWILGVGYRERTRTASLLPSTAVPLPTIPGGWASAFSRFAYNLQTSVMYNVALPFCSDPAVDFLAVCNKITMDSKGVYEFHAVSVNVHCDVRAEMSMRMLCPFCEVRQADECKCSRDFRLRLSQRLPPVDNWIQFQQNARANWIFGRRGTIHQVVPSGSVLPACATQELSYCFSGKEFDGMVRGFLSRCWEMNSASLGADQLLAITAPDATQEDKGANVLDPDQSLAPSEIERLLRDLVFDGEWGCTDTAGPCLEGREDTSDVSKRRTSGSEEKPKIESTPYECPECKQTFAVPFNLRRHMQAKHQKARPFTCDQCDAAFSQSQNLTRHRKTVHLKQRAYVCPHCGLALTTLSNLERHIRRRHSS
eukprot:Plantae.Rhodophyta-Rhodochaete_pulchella.ctg59696.p1 GENE.Plantae.Rhodophyta-Rhodochaete_pulchella.ctg59696~~Plantae.Rhodophyta-Rhodochaete_pulchella.ctg59696.p1  ORF type:complete len:401 (-),score=28.58 Plantae.Rhodophyta-Rhodochaete_pulchella.ctg59696:427-1575(-)